MTTLTDTAAMAAPEPADAPTAAEAIIAARTGHDAATRLSDARQAHAEAIENANLAKERAIRAETAHKQALTCRGALLDRAATGEAIDEAGLHSARIAATEAQDAMELAGSIAAGAATRAERAHVKVLFAEAADHQGRYREAVAARIIAAEHVDAASVAHQAAIREFNETGLAVSTTANGCRLHDYQTIPDIARTNRVLAALEDGNQPKAGTPPTPIMRPVKMAYVTNASGELTEEKIVTLAARERSLFGIPTPGSTAEEPRYETALERQARERAWADAHTGKAPSFTPTATRGVFRQ